MPKSDTSKTTDVNNREAEKEYVQQFALYRYFDRFFEACKDYRERQLFLKNMETLSAAQNANSINKYIIQSLMDKAKSKLDEDLMNNYDTISYQPEMAGKLLEDFRKNPPVLKANPDAKTDAFSVEDFTEISHALRRLSHSLYKEKDPRRSLKIDESVENADALNELMRVGSAVRKLKRAARRIDRDYDILRQELGPNHQIIREFENNVPEAADKSFLELICDRSLQSLSRYSADGEDDNVDNIFEKYDDPLSFYLSRRRNRWGITFSTGLNKRAEQALYSLRDTLQDLENTFTDLQVKYGIHLSQYEIDEDARFLSTNKDLFPELSLDDLDEDEKEAFSVQTGRLTSPNPKMPSMPESENKVHQEAVSVQTDAAQAESTQADASSQADVKNPDPKTADNKIEAEEVVIKPADHPELRVYNALERQTNGKKEYFADYDSFIKNADGKIDPATVERINSNDISVLAALAEEYPKYPGLQTYIDHRIQQLKTLNEMFNHAKVQEAPAVKAEKNGDVVLPIHMPETQSTSNGCWSVALAEQLAYRGTNVKQETIRAYRPGNDRPNINRDAGNDISDFTALLQKLMPNTAVNTLSCVTYNKDVAKNALSDAINRALKVNNSPLSILTGGHYLTVFGMKSGRLLVHDPQQSKEVIMTVDDFLQRGKSGTGSYKIDAAWAQDLKLDDKNEISLDGSTTDNKKVVYDSNGVLKRDHMGVESLMFSTAVYEDSVFVMTHVPVQMKRTAPVLDQNAQEKKKPVEPEKTKKLYEYANHLEQIAENTNYLEQIEKHPNTLQQLKKDASNLQKLEKKTDAKAEEEIIECANDLQKLEKPSKEYLDEAEKMPNLNINDAKRSNQQRYVHADGGNASYLRSAIRKNLYEAEDANLKVVANAILKKATKNETFGTEISDEGKEHFSPEQIRVYVTGVHRFGKNGKVGKCVQDLGVSEEMEPEEKTEVMQGMGKTKAAIVYAIENLQKNFEKQLYAYGASDGSLPMFLDKDIDRLSDACNAYFEEHGYANDPENRVIREIAKAADFLRAPNTYASEMNSGSISAVMMPGCKRTGVFLKKADYQSDSRAYRKLEDTFTDVLGKMEKNSSINPVTIADVKELQNAAKYFMNVQKKNGIRHNDARLRYDMASEVYNLCLSVTGKETNKKDLEEIRSELYPKKTKRTQISAAELDEKLNPVSIKITTFSNTGSGVAQKSKKSKGL